MVARLENEALQQFLEDRVREGQFPSVNAALEAAVMQMKREVEIDEPLDAETQAALDAADAAVARGEVRPWSDVRAELIRDLGLKL